MSEDEKEEVKRIIFELETKDNIPAEFLVPIESMKKDKSHIQNYIKCIDSPINLYTIKQKLREGKLHSKLEFFRDLESIWKNCFEVSKDNKDSLHKRAIILKEEIANITNSVRNKKNKGNINSPCIKENDYNCLSVEKCVLISKINKLSEVGNLELVAFLYNNFPNCLEQNSEEVRINFDILSKPNLIRFEKFLDKFNIQGAEESLEQNEIRGLTDVNNDTSKLPHSEIEMSSKEKGEKQKITKSKNRNKLEKHPINDSHKESRIFTLRSRNRHTGTLSMLLRNKK